MKSFQKLRNILLQYLTRLTCAGSVFFCKFSLNLIGNHGCLHTTGAYLAQLNSYSSQTQNPQGKINQ